MTAPHDPATVDTAAPDVHQASAEAMVPHVGDEERLFEHHACRTDCGPCACSGIPYPSAAVRAAVDRAVELTEQRVRAEMAPRHLCGNAAPMLYDQLHQLVCDKPAGHEGHRDSVRDPGSVWQPDVDGMAADIERLTNERDEARAQLTQALSLLNTTRAERDQHAAAYRALVGDLPELAGLLRELVGALRGAEVDAEWTAAADRDTLRAVDGHSWAAGFEAGYATGRDDEAASLPLRTFDEMAAGSGPGARWTGSDAPGVPESTPDVPGSPQGATGRTTTTEGTPQ